MPRAKTGQAQRPQPSPNADTEGAAAGTEGAAATGGDLFYPISVGKMSEMIVERIRLLIRQGQLRQGDRLPAERDLCERFGVSRVTVREALRVLESSGLVEIRVGARGGAFVTAPSSDHVGEGIADLISLSAVSPAQVTEARRILELGLVPLVCARATERDIADLREICARAQTSAREHSGTYSMEISVEFHIRVAEASHNPAIRMLAESFRRPLLMSLEAAHNLAPEMGKVGHQEHLAFVDAVTAGDTDTATRIMGAHLDRTARRVSAERGAKARGRARRGRQSGVKA